MHKSRLGAFPARLDDRQLRVFGGVILAIGVGTLWLVRRMA